MERVSATKLRRNVFAYLDRVAAGESIVIERNNREVARLVGTERPNWRDKMKVRPRLLVSPEELIEPLDGVWEEYV